MTALVLLTALLCYGFAHYYLPPSPSYRVFPDLSPTLATIGALLALNFAVFISWRVTPFWPVLVRYFMHVPGYPRAAQSILNMFSHVEYEHFLGNMMVLVLVGPVCHELVGRGTFLGTYIAAGAFGTLASLYWSNVGRGLISSHSVGASAALWGIAALYLLYTDAESIQIPFLKEFEVAFWPKMLFVAFVAAEIRQAFRGKRNHDHASHFGGMFVGMCVAGYMRATGIHEKKAPLEVGVQKGEEGNNKTVDLGAMARESVKEVQTTIAKPFK
jgi:rhomboid-like protein